jgi:hypothetical protein
MPSRLVMSPALMAANAKRFFEITAVPFDGECHPRSWTTTVTAFRRRLP